ncbi:T9SS type A sorting domain-containing protein [Carboxylicivirga marina]|uniref:T9SS type A sorting domain-containing protein n=1 Tax=Carboxylicivirga marina TaxID=2800988 RepID=UPI00338E2C3A
MTGVSTLATNLSNEDLYKSLKVYPNPVINEMTIDITNDMAKQIRVFNSTGRIVKAFVQSNELNSIPMGDLPQDIYFLQIKLESSDTTLTRKIVKR